MSYEIRLEVKKPEAVDALTFMSWLCARLGIGQMDDHRVKHSVIQFKELADVISFAEIRHDKRLVAVRKGVDL